MSVRRLGLFLFIGLGALGGTAQAQTTNPHWIRPPDPDATGVFMPSFANTLGIEGRATIRCEVEKPGSPENCEVMAESPDGLGFGQAGIYVMNTGYLAPKMVAGRPVRAEVSSTIHFRAFPLDLIEATTPIYTGPTPTAEAISLGQSIVRRDIDKLLADKTNDLQGLDPARHAPVNAWIAEIMPPDRTEMIETLGLALARLFSEADLQAMLSNGTDPGDYPGRRDWDTATEDQFSRREQKGIETLRARYCAAYSCTMAPRVR